MIKLLFNPGLLTTFQRRMTFRSVFQCEGNYVILAPKVYHGSFNTRCTVENATKFVEQLGEETGIVLLSNQEMGLPLHQCIGTNEMILWKERYDLVFFCSGHTSQSLC